MMSGIRGKNTKPEILVRRALHKAGLRFRLSSGSKLPGRPDVVLPRYGTVVFVHGCFWHRHARCRFAYTPKSNRTFWFVKFRENVARDARALRELHRIGWRTLVVWECQITPERLAFLADRIRQRTSR